MEWASCKALGTKILHMPRETIDVDFLTEVWNVEEETGLWAFWFPEAEAMKEPSPRIPLPYIWHVKERFCTH